MVSVDNSLARSSGPCQTLSQVCSDFSLVLWASSYNSRKGSSQSMSFLSKSIVILVKPRVAQPASVPLLGEPPTRRWLVSCGLTFFDIPFQLFQVVSNPHKVCYVAYEPMIGLCLTSYIYSSIASIICGPITSIPRGDICSGRARAARWRWEYALPPTQMRPIMTLSLEFKKGRAIFIVRLILRQTICNQKPGCLIYFEPLRRRDSKNRSIR